MVKYLGWNGIWLVSVDCCCCCCWGVGKSMITLWPILLCVVGGGGGQIMVGIFKCLL